MMNRHRRLGDRLVWVRLVGAWELNGKGRLGALPIKDRSLFVADADGCGVRLGTRWGAERRSRLLEGLVQSIR